MLHRIRNIRIETTAIYYCIFHCRAPRRLFGRFCSQAFLRLERISSACGKLGQSWPSPSALNASLNLPLCLYHFDSFRIAFPLISTLFSSDQRQTLSRLGSGARQWTKIECPQFGRPLSTSFLLVLTTSIRCHEELLCIATYCRLFYFLFGFVKGEKEAQLTTLITGWHIHRPKIVNQFILGERKITLVFRLIQELVNLSAWLRSNTVF